MAGTTLVVLTPGVIGQAFVEMVAAGTPPDPERMRAVMERHGLVPVPPSG